MPPIVYGMHSTDTSLNEMYNPTQDLLALTISRTGSYVASFHVDKKLRVFSWSDSKVLLEREFDIDVDSPQDSNHRQHLVFANNEDRLALIGRKGQPGIQIIDRTTGDLVSWLQMDSLPEAAAFSPEGDTLACIDPNGIVHVFDVTTRRLLQRYAHHKTAIDPWQSEQWRAAVAWSDDGRFLITVRHTTALIWDNQTRTFRQSDREYPRSTGDVWRPFLSPNGQLAIEHNSEMVRIWNTQSGQPLLTFYWSDPDHWLAVSPEGHYHCSDQMRTLLVWVIRKDDGTCELLSKEDFATKYNWVNDPYRVALHLD
jgi:WD40 repeat protein